MRLASIAFGVIMFPISTHARHAILLRQNPDVSTLSPVPLNRVTFQHVVHHFVGVGDAAVRPAELQVLRKPLG